MGPLMFSQLYAMNPSVELALASSSVSVTITWLMLAAASLLGGGRWQLLAYGLMGALVLP